jgi:hypothetical protein
VEERTEKARNAQAASLAAESLEEKSEGNLCGRLWVKRGDRALALVRGMASLFQRKLGKDQRRLGSRKKPAPLPLQRALKQE